METLFPPLERERCEPGLKAHLERTAALAREVAAELHVPEALAPVLEQAVLLHHAPAAMARHANVPEWGRLDDVLNVLAHFHGEPAPNAGAAHLTLSGILKACDVLDQELEAMPASGTTIEQVLGKLWALVDAGGVLPEAVAAIQVWSADMLGDFSDLPARLAVNPEAARQVRELLAGRHCDLSRLESMARKDPVLAASVIRVANSSLFSPAMPISRLGVAIAFIGPQNTRNAMVAAAIRPLYASSGLERLWNHSLQTARFAEALAELTHVTDTAEGFLLGLMHDVGRLAVQHFPKVLAERHARLIERGSPVTHAELCVFRCEHGQIGDAVLRTWGFPDEFCEAVRDHHQPERSESRLSAFLYLAECGVGGGEDVPSIERVARCCQRTGISLAAIQALAPAETSLATVLAVEA
jgi:HD-like signal output (HDOD) protein